MANPVTVSIRPQYLNANTLVYNMWDLRRYMDGPPPGPGVFGYEDWRVLPKQAGVNLSVDVGKTGVGLMQGWVRGSTRGGQGLYRIDNVDTTAPTADTYLGQFNVDVASNGSGNPRIDIVVLEVLDAQHTGASSLAQIRVISGTPTAAATLDNRTGAAAIPTSAILLADIIIANLDVTVDAVDIRDRRQWPLNGVNPQPVGTPVDSVSFLPPGSVPAGTMGCSIQSTNDTWQVAGLCYLPRRIVGATRVRFRYMQAAIANAGNYIIGIYDASGRQIVATPATAYVGAANVATEVSLTIAATTFEAGSYYIMIGNAVATAGSSVNTHGLAPAVSGASGPTTRNIIFRNTVGGTALPTTILAMTDVASITATTTVSGVPLITLSVG